MQQTDFDTARKDADAEDAAALCKRPAGQKARTRQSGTRRITRTAIIAALYIALTFAFAFCSFAGIQFRISEVLTILPLFFPEAIVGITVGCLLSNILGNGVWDVVLGSAASLVAAVLTHLIGRTNLKDTPKIILGILPPVLINAFVVPFTFLAVTQLKELYWINVLTVGLGQAAVLCILGIPFYYLIRKLKGSVNLLK